MGAEGWVESSLHKVTGKDQEENVEVGGLVVSELDQRIVDEKSIVFGELEAPIAWALGKYSWQKRGIEEWGLQGKLFVGCLAQVVKRLMVIVHVVDRID
jgi:hypothetical protein